MAPEDVGAAIETARSIGATTLETGELTKFSLRVGQSTMTGYEIEIWYE